MEGGVILGTMVRLVRNLKGEVFPGWSTKESRARVAETLAPIIRSLPGFRQAAHAEMTELNQETRKLLLERKLITPCLAARQDGSHVYFNKKQDIAVMLNEEEHLAIHLFAEANKLYPLLEEANKLAKSMEESLEFAKAAPYGYLTSMAAECGDGLQMYMVLHLPGHAMLNQIEKIERALNKLHLNISPFYTEYGDETGDLYVLFSTPAPNGTVHDIMEHLQNIAENLVEKETLLRHKILAENDFSLTDAIGRAYGTLQYGHLLGFSEMLHIISLMRLALHLDLITSSHTTEELQQILSFLQLDSAPSHLAYPADSTDEALLPLKRMISMQRFSSLVNSPAEDFKLFQSNV